MSDNHPPLDPKPVIITRSPQQASAENISNQCTRVKVEAYRLKELIEQHTHAEQRAEALRLWNAAYNAFQAVQSNIEAQ